MIGLLVTGLLAVTQVVEMPDPSANTISIQAIVKLPKLGAKDLAKLRILSRAWPKQTEDYARREMLMITDGQPVQCELTPDALRIGFDVLPSKLNAGLSLAESLVERPAFNDDGLQSAAQDDVQPDYWGSALDPVLLPPVVLGHDEAMVLYHRVVRPERVTLAVGGKFVSGAAEDNWNRRTENWDPGAEPKGYFDITPLQYRTTNATAITTIDFGSSPVLPDDAALATKILALFALGTGKGASLFRVVREKHGWSYRQESMLTPTMDGWLPRLLIASIPTSDVGQRADAIKSDLTADVAAWTEADLARAVGMAEAVLARNVEFSPFYVFGSRPVGSSLDDRTFMAGYWKMKTGRNWDPVAMLSSMKLVPLDDLKGQASQLVATSKAQILPGQ